MTKEQLSDLLNKSEAQLAALKSIDYDGLKGRIVELESLLNEFSESGKELLSADSTLQLGIVGQVKAGKSSFLNSLFFNGENVLPKASTPMTAGLTIMEYSDTNTFEVEYFNEKDWSIFVAQNEEYNKRKQEVMAQMPNASENVIRKELRDRISDKLRSAHEMIEGCTINAKQKIGSPNDSKEFFDVQDLQNVLDQYVGAKGEFTSVVKSLYIRMNDERLKGLRVVDTPGVNDPVVSRENRTRAFLNSCHGVFLLSSSSQFLNSCDVSFLNDRIGGSGIGTVVLLASKFDSVLEDVGAERVMRREEPGDLSDTAEQQTRKFKRRLRELSDTINANLRGKIKLDTTAGIGYSIARKPASKWDNVEQNVVEQMKRYYPDYFSTEEELRETFEQLANIEDIRKNYLDGIFKANKESIIAHKIKAFFQNNRQQVSDAIDNLLNEFIERRKELNEMTVAEVQRQRAMQQNLFDGLKDTFANIFAGFSRSLQLAVKNIANNIPFQEVRTIPTESINGPISYKGMIYGHNTDDMDYNQVNTFALSEQIRGAVKCYAESWNKEWQKLFDSARTEIAEKLNRSISDFEGQIMSKSFQDTYYRRLIDNVLEELRSNKELEIRKIIDDGERQGDDIANNQFSPSGTRELKKDEVKHYLEMTLREHNKDLVMEMRNLADSIKEDVSKEVNKNLNSAIETINEMKNKFADKLKKEGEEYLANLEKDMEEKTAVLNVLNTIIDNVKALSTLFKQ